jgi:hypothetical protein
MFVRHTISREIIIFRHGFGDVKLQFCHGTPVFTSQLHASLVLLSASESSSPPGTRDIELHSVNPSPF